MNTFAQSYMICTIMLKKKKDIIYVFLENWMDISYLKLNSLYPMMLCHWRIQEFFNQGGGGGPGAV